MKKHLKRSIVCFALAIVMILSITPAFADTLSAHYSGYCYRAFTPSAKLQKSSNTTAWSWINAQCTQLSYYCPGDDDENGLHYHVLKSYNSTGGAAAENQEVYHWGLGDEDNIYYLYNGQKYTPKITFKVYNGYYYEFGDQTQRLYTDVNVIGHLGS